MIGNSVLLLIVIDVVVDAICCYCCCDVMAFRYCCCDVVVVLLLLIVPVRSRFINSLWQLMTLLLLLIIRMLTDIVDDCVGVPCYSFDRVDGYCSVDGIVLLLLFIRLLLTVL